ncbi:polysaccharide biosynthesis protein, partial [Cytobacillus firmus]|uniref:polysaccharide biosynthesis protein n=1 Tax=Cytobacillus firmus TaxID=1399 RepID=UPI0030007517
LVFKSTLESIGGEIFVMKMPTCRILDLAQVLIEASNIKNVDIEILGIRPGEKIHEMLLSEYESTKTLIFDNDYFVILPAINIKGLKEHYSKYKSVKIINYNSSTGLMNKEEIKDLLMKGRLI